MLAVIGGALTGVVYALAALGLVVVYRATRILNFAHGAMGMLSAYIFGRWLYQPDSFLVHAFGADHPLRSKVAALLLTLVFAIGLGLVVERAVIRPLKDTSILTKVIATLAFLTVLQYLAGAIFGDATYFFASIFTNGSQQLGVLDVGITSVPYSALYNVVVTAAIVVGLTLFLRFTKLGTALRAVSNDPDAAGLAGINVTRVNQVAWVLGSVLAAVAGLLLIPDTNLNTFTLTLTVILYGVGAAVFGGLVSLPLTLLGGIFLGIATAIARAYAPSDLPGLDYVVGFLIVILVLSVRRDITVGVLQ
jgi:branched-subunit amino acid ABC-type transport system permease component